jgi:hypothetical protein
MNTWRRQRNCSSAENVEGTIAKVAGIDDLNITRCEFQSLHLRVVMIVLPRFWSVLVLEDVFVALMPTRMMHWRSLTSLANI